MPPHVLTGIGGRYGGEKGKERAVTMKYPRGVVYILGLLSSILTQNWEHRRKGTIWEKKSPLVLDILSLTRFVKHLTKNLPCSRKDLKGELTNTHKLK